VPGSAFGSAMRKISKRNLLARRCVRRPGHDGPPPSNPVRRSLPLSGRHDPPAQSAFRVRERARNEAASHSPA